MAAVEQREKARTIADIARLAAGQRRVISFMPDVRTLYVQEEQLRAVDPQLHSFFNTNTPEEWAEATRLLAGS